MGKSSDKQTLHFLMEFIDPNDPEESTRTEHTITSDRGTIGLVQAVAIGPGLKKMDDGFQALFKLKTMSEYPEFADFLADLDKA